jgi:uncharacterized membrane protein YidH (DUF202 family)
MIRGYSDHAANERTFLAWVRTGIAVIAFGFVIEKFTPPPLKQRIDCSSKGCRDRSGATAALLSSLAASHLSWPQPRASSVPGDCLMTRRCTPPAAYAPS